MTYFKVRYARKTISEVIGIAFINFLYRLYLVKKN